MCQFSENKVQLYKDNLVLPYQEKLYECTWNKSIYEIKLQWQFSLTRNVYLYYFHELATRNNAFDSAFQEYYTLVGFSFNQFLTDPV